METMFRITRRAALMCCMVCVGLTVFVACDKDDDNDRNNMYTISGNANGANMVPSVAGTGTAGITGTYNGDTRVLTYTTNWNGLTGAPTTGGFYNGAVGQNGTAMGSPWTYGTNPTATGSTTGQMTLSADQATQMTGGNWYYSMGTATNSGGEVRGQITATPSQ
jgi:hypothetical protein